MTKQSRKRSVFIKLWIATFRQRADLVKTDNFVIASMSEAIQKTNKMLEDLYGSPCRYAPREDEYVPFPWKQKLTNRLVLIKLVDSPT